MKSLFKKPWVLGLIILLSIGLFRPLKTQAQPVHVSFQIFYDNLQPYGQWINDPTYGYIWVPNVDPGFIPYATRGYWVPTPYGNTWVSDYPWGWATFHYGRWFYDDFYGWVWLPDTVWGPGWVDWRYGDGYYGWAPLGPSIGVSISIPLFSWVFVPQRHFLSHRVYDYYVPRNQVNVIINRTKVINNTYVYNNQRYYGGPRPSEIERATKSKVHVYQVGNLDRPGGATIKNGSVRLFRPQVERRNNVAPSHAVDAATYKARHGERGMPSGGNQAPAPGNARPQRGVNPAENQPHNQPGQTQPARQEQPHRRQAPEGQAVPQRQPAQQPQQERQPHREVPQQRQPAQQPQQERQPHREAPQRQQPAQQPQQERQPHREAPQRQPAQQPQQERQPQRQQAPPRQERQQQPQRQQAPQRQERQQQRESRPPRQERPQREQHPQKQRDGKSEDRHH